MKNEGMREKKNLRTGILGGTFDPVHNGHLAIARAALNELGLAEVWLIPAKTSPFKIGKTHVSDMDRLRMVELACAGERELIGSNYEMRKKGVSYTCRTLSSLKNEFPGREWFFITGADAFVTMDTWKEPETIFSCASIVVSGREGVEPDQLSACIKKYEEQYGAKVSMLTTALPTISSTTVRNMIREGKSCDTLLPATVARYIAQKGLYRQKG